jgi:outer membrane protein OmpA-like peptidoglycan-associated protein
MTAHEFRSRGAIAAVAMMVLLTGCASVTLVPAGRLTPVKDRVTDEAIARDLAIFDSYERRLSTAAPSPTGAQRYVAARAAEYVRVAREAYERNDRTHFVDDALAWAVADIETLERGNAEGALASVVPIPTGATPLDPALWARAEGLRKGAATLAQPEDVARAEGQLLRAGHVFLAGPACVDERPLAAANRFLDDADKGGKVPPPVVPARDSQPTPDTPVTPVTPADSNRGNNAVDTRPGCTSPDVLAGVPSIVHFALDKSFLAPETRTVLDALVATLKENPGIRVKLGGHTDVRASDAYNQALSERRVDAVRQYLRGKGLSDAQLMSQAFGEKRVLVDGTKAMDHARNRRVAITYIRCDGSEAQAIEQLNDIQLEAAKRKAIYKEKD